LRAASPASCACSHSRKPSSSYSWRTDRHHLEAGRQQAVAQQVHQRRKQVAHRQVAGGAEQQQGVVAAHSITHTTAVRAGT
jgi:hypothetical protein